jgi:hypothetical protein
MKIGGFGTWGAFIPRAGGLQIPKIEASGTSMPTELVQQLDEYRQWAISNKNDARRDTVQFWMLKIPAIITSASSSALAYFNAKTVSIVAGSVAAVCVLIDSVHPRGGLRNVHWRAFNEISKLVADMEQEWRLASLHGKIKTEDEARAEAARIIEKVRPEVDRINQNIITAEGWITGKPDK